MSLSNMAEEMKELRIMFQKLDMSYFATMEDPEETQAQEAKPEVSA